MNYGLLAIRNIVKNGRRSLITLCAVAFGFASVSLFAGYVANVYKGLVRQAIQGELLGHLSIAKRGLRTEGKLHPERFIFSAAEIQKVRAILNEYPHTVLVTPRLSLSGIVTNGSASTIFIGEGVEPRDSKVIQGDFNRKMAGEVREDAPSGIAVATGLSQILNLQKGGSGALLVNTVNGQANALDVDIVDTFNTGNAGTNDKFVYLPLSLAQKLYDIDGAERLTVLLDDKQYTEDARRFLETRLRQAGFDPEIQTWLEMSSFYKQVKGLFDMIFMFIFSIVLIVVVMSVINSMSMTVLERTREIGTLRAMGLRRQAVVRLFATEALTLVLIGSAAGMTITALVRLAVNSAGITYQPPNSSNVVRLLVDLDPARIALTFGLMAILGVAAAYLPARHAARRTIIDSLAHV